MSDGDCCPVDHVICILLECGSPGREAGEGCSQGKMGRWRCWWRICWDLIQKEVLLKH